MRVLLVFWFCIYSGLVAAQTQENKFSVLYSDVVESYRMELVEGHQQELIALDSLVNTYVDSIPEIASRGEAFTVLHYLLLYTDWIRWPFDAVDYAEMREIERKNLKDFPPAQAKIISDCKPLIEMIGDSVLSPYFPFEVLPPDEFDQSFLAFIQPKSGEVVAEIGAGNGFHGLLLAAAYPKAIFVLNDIVEPYVNYVNQKITTYPEVFGHNRIVGIVGDKRATMMQDASVDHMLIDNTYHHFTKEKDMLFSIRETLKPTGSLYIVEPVYLRKRERTAVDCNKVKPRAKVIEEITKAGFRLVEEQTLEEWYLLRFEAKQ